jgi:hypothetical protein
MNDTGHWTFPFEFTASEWFGFIYKITELSTGREYIGKKQFTNIRKKVVKDRKNKKTVKSESNWKSYTGSSTELNLQIKELGVDNYKFEIQSLHETKGSLYYAEVISHITNDVLRAKLPTGDKKYYNKWIGAVKFIPPSETLKESTMKVAHNLVN